MSKIDWNSVEREFAAVRSLVAPIISADEIDAFKASISHPHLVSSSLSDKLGHGYLLVPAARQDLAKYAVDILVSNTDEDVPSFIATDIPDHMTVIESAIASRELSLAFLHSWGVVQQAAGIFITFVTGDNMEGNFLSGLKSAQKADVTLQRYWYAWWIKCGGFLEGVNRAALDDELAELCENIIKGRKRTAQFDVKWFDKMLSKEGVDGRALTTTYTRMTRHEIERLVVSPYIRPNVLPPLSTNEFQNG